MDKSESKSLISNQAHLRSALIRHRAGVNPNKPMEEPEWLVMDIQYSPYVPDSKYWYSHAEGHTVGSVPVDVDIGS